MQFTEQVEGEVSMEEGPLLLDTSSTITQSNMFKKCKILTSPLQTGQQNTSSKGKKTKPASRSATNIGGSTWADIELAATSLPNSEFLFPDS